MRGIGTYLQDATLEKIITFGSFLDFQFFFDLHFQGYFAFLKLCSSFQEPVDRHFRNKSGLSLSSFAPPLTYFPHGVLSSAE